MMIPSNPLFAYLIIWTREDTPPETSVITSGDKTLLTSSACSKEEEDSSPEYRSQLFTWRGKSTSLSHTQGGISWEFTN